MAVALQSFDSPYDSTSCLRCFSPCETRPVSYASFLGYRRIQTTIEARYPS